MHDSLTILGHEFLLYGREFPPMEDRRSEGEHWTGIYLGNITEVLFEWNFLVQIQSASASQDKKATRFVDEAKLRKGDRGCNARLNKSIVI